MAPGPGVVGDVGRQLLDGGDVARRGGAERLEEGGTVRDGRLVEDGDDLPDALAELPAWDDETLLTAMKDLAERLEVKNAKVMWPVRIAVSGRAVTPGGAVEICRILGRDETLRRIDAGIAKLEG